MADTWRQKWPKTEFWNSRSNSSTCSISSLFSLISKDKKKSRMRTLNSTKNSTVTTTMSSPKRKMRTKTSKTTWSRVTCNNSRRIGRHSKNSCPWLSNFQPSFSICARSSKTWPSRKIIRRPIRCSRKPIKSRSRSDKSTWMRDIRRFWQLKRNWCRNNRMKWTRCARSLRAGWTSSWNCVRWSTTNFCKDMRTRRSNWKINKHWREINWRSITKLDQVQPKAKAWWQASLRWELRAWVSLMLHAESEQSQRHRG